MIARSWLTWTVVVATYLAAATEGGAASSMIGTLPATFRMRENVKTVSVAHVPGPDLRSVTRGLDHSRLLLSDDATFAWTRFARPGAVAPGTWQETSPGVVAVTFDAAVVADLDAGLTSRVRKQRGFRNAEVTCSLGMMPLVFAAGGKRLTSDLDVLCAVTGGAADIDIHLHVHYRGKRTKR